MVESCHPLQVLLRSGSHHIQILCRMCDSRKGRVLVTLIGPKFCLQICQSRSCKRRSHRIERGRQNRWFKSFSYPFICRRHRRVQGIYRLSSWEYQSVFQDCRLSNWVWEDCQYSMSQPLTWITTIVRPGYMWSRLRMPKQCNSECYFRCS